MKLNDYMQQNIFKPLGLSNLNMFPTQHMKDNLADMHQRWNGICEERDHIYRNALRAETPEQQARIFNSGGAGLFAKPSEYTGKYICRPKPAIRDPSDPLLTRFQRSSRSSSTKASTPSRAFRS